MYFAIGFSIMLVTNFFPLDHYPEHCFSVKRTRSCGRDYRNFAKDMNLTKEFQCSHTIYIYNI